MTKPPPSEGPAQCDDGGLGPQPEFGEFHRKGLAETVRYWNLAVQGIWLHYFSLGGDVGEYELDAYINASYKLSPLQHDILAQAVNELIDMRPAPPRAPYSNDVSVVLDPRKGEEGDDTDE